MLINLVDGQKWIKIVHDLLWPSLSTVVPWGHIISVMYVYLLC